MGLCYVQFTTNKLIATHVLFHGVAGAGFPSGVQAELWKTSSIEGLIFSVEKGHIHCWQALDVMSNATIHAKANAVWNKRGRLPVSQWLSQGKLQKAEQHRLHTLGNVVIPACGRLALHTIAHAIQHDARYAR